MPTHRGRRWAGSPLGRAGIAVVAVAVLASAACAGALPHGGARADAHETAGESLFAIPAAEEAAIIVERMPWPVVDAILSDLDDPADLHGEVERVLALIRERHPAMAEIQARDPFIPGVLIVRLEGALRDTVVGLWREEDAARLPPTGHADFDSLNERLGLRAAEVLRYTGVVIMHYRERIDLVAAMMLYTRTDGVSEAYPTHMLGDGDDIEVTKSGGTWYVVFRRAWGDCPAGCIYREYSFFTVAEGEVERVEPAQAREAEPFATLLADRGWR